MGTGVEWKPLTDKKKLSLISNILWYWEATTMKKWDKERALPVSSADGETALFKGASWDSWSKGWVNEDQDASRMLGTELNFEAIYRPVANCKLLVQLACFLPGQL